MEEQALAQAEMAALEALAEVVVTMVVQDLVTVLLFPLHKVTQAVKEITTVTVVVEPQDQDLDLIKLIIF